MTVVPHVQREPLTGNISRDGQQKSLTGNVIREDGSTDYMVPISPALAGSVSKRVPPAMFRAWLEKAHSNFALKASSMSDGEVLEVKGAWDNAAKTLHALGIPFTHVRAGELRDYPLEHVRVLILNCAGKVPRDSLQRIRDWVAHGGFLLTTDWALDNFVQKAFPGYIEWNRDLNRQPVYDAFVCDPDPVLFQYTVANATWKLDEDSHLLRVLKPDAVRVLVRSRGLVRDDVDGQGILAVTFPFGRGQVLHLVGHFDNNAGLGLLGSLPDPAPMINISLRQAMATNFIVAGLTDVRVPQRGR